MKNSFFIAILCAGALANLASGADQANSASITLPPETATLRHSDLPGYIAASSKCVICHSVDYINFQPPGMNQIQWTAEVTKMQRKYGAPISDNEVAAIGAYLAVAYGSANASDDSINSASQRIVTDK